jgi:dihydropteroate synthase
MQLPFGSRTFIMGILNLTPDSFSGDGLGLNADPAQAALAQARAFVAAGVDILDVGGESTRPGAQTVSEQQELERVVPVVELLAHELDCLISVDTFKAGVAEAALAAGADWVNDVWGLRADARMAGVVSAAHAPVVLMHNRSRAGATLDRAGLGKQYLGSDYTDLLEDVRRELLECVAAARAAGIQDENIILDPGIGFGKTLAQNLELIDRLGEIRQLGFPVLLGVSRKGFIGYTLSLPVEERLEGSLAAAVVGIARGADILRVHDVAATVRAARMADAILRRRTG